MAGLLDIRNTFGVFFCGLIVTAGLFGVNTLQVIFYFLFYPDDKRNIKLLVTFVWFVDAAQLIFTGQSVYNYLISNFGNPLGLLRANFSLLAQIVATSLITCTVQIYFAFRVRSFGKGGQVCCAITILFALASFGFSAAFTERCFALRSFFKVQQLKGIFIGQVICSLLTDVLITASQVYFLNLRKTGYQRTNRLINRILILVVNQGLLTCIVATSELTLYLASPTTFWFISAHCLISKSYALSLFASLNARHSLRAIVGASNQAPSGPQMQMPMVHITSTKHQHVDDIDPEMPTERFEVDVQLPALSRNGGHLDHHGVGVGMMKAGGASRAPDLYGSYPGYQKSQSRS